MPASMIRAEVGGSLKVSGSSMAMVATGPMPGSTPISVPTMQPIRQYSRFWKVSATPKPSMTCPSSSMSPHSPDNADVHAQAELEEDDAQRRQDGACENGLDHLEFLAAQRRQEDQRDERGRHAGR